MNEEYNFLINEFILAVDFINIINITSKIALKEKLSKEQLVNDLDLNFYL